MDFFMRLQGLPLEATSRDIRYFFRDFQIPVGGIHIVGGVDDEAHITFAIEDDLLQALQLDTQHLCGKPVRLLLAKKGDEESFIGSQPSAHNPSDTWSGEDNHETRRETPRADDIDAPAFESRPPEVKYKILDFSRESIIVDDVRKPEKEERKVIIVREEDVKKKERRYEESRGKSTRDSEKAAFPKDRKKDETSRQREQRTVSKDRESKKDKPRHEKQRHTVSKERESKNERPRHESKGREKSKFESRSHDREASSRKEEVKRKDEKNHDESSRKSAKVGLSIIDHRSKMSPKKREAEIERRDQSKDREREKRSKETIRSQEEKSSKTKETSGKSQDKSKEQKSSNKETHSRKEGEAKKNEISKENQKTKEKGEKSKDRHSQSHQSKDEKRKDTSHDKKLESDRSKGKDRNKQDIVKGKSEKNKDQHRKSDGSKEKEKSKQEKRDRSKDLEKGRDRPKEKDRSDKSREKEKKSGGSVEKDKSKPDTHKDKIDQSSKQEKNRDASREKDKSKEEKRDRSIYRERGRDRSKERVKSTQDKSARSTRSRDRDSHSKELKRHSSDISEIPRNRARLEPGHVIVFNLPCTVTATDLRDYFSRYEIVDKGIIMTISESKLGNLNAGVKFVFMEDAIKAEGMSAPLHGRPVDIQFVSERMFIKTLESKSSQGTPQESYTPGSGPYPQYGQFGPPGPWPHYYTPPGPFLPPQSISGFPRPSGPPPPSPAQYFMHGAPFYQGPPNLPHHHMPYMGSGPPRPHLPVGVTDPKPSQANRATNNIAVQNSFHDIPSTHKEGQSNTLTEVRSSISPEIKGTSSSQTSDIEVKEPKPSLQHPEAIPTQDVVESSAELPKSLGADDGEHIQDCYIRVDNVHPDERAQEIWSTLAAEDPPPQSVLLVRNPKLAATFAIATYYRDYPVNFKRSSVTTVKNLSLQLCTPRQRYTSLTEVPRDFTITEAFDSDKECLVTEITDQAGRPPVKVGSAKPKRRRDRRDEKYKYK